MSRAHSLPPRTPRLTPLPMPPRLAAAIRMRAGLERMQVPAGLAQARERPFFQRAQGRRFDVHAQDDATEIDLYDEIGFWGVSAQQFRDMLPRQGKVRLRINSPGGDVFDGIAMFNDLLQHDGEIEVMVTGLAASAASIVAMAADRMVMAESAFLMIHNAWTIMLGDRHAMRQVADVLEQIDAGAAKTYAARSNLAQDAVVAAMDAETWYTAEEAQAAGFADAVEPTPEKPQARFDLSAYRHTPKALLDQATPGPKGDGTPTRRDLERTLTQDAGLSRSQARKLLADGLSAVEATQDAGDDAALVASFRTLIDSMTL